MAQYTRWIASKRLTLSVGNTVGESLRRAAVNDPDDVLLVQFLLNGIFDTKMSSIGLGRRLVLDGVFGQHTHYRLLLFQRQIFQTGPAMFSVTGQVSLQQLDGGPMATMDHLNAWYFQGNPRIVTVKDLEAALPPRLRPALEGGAFAHGVEVAYGALYD